MSSLNKVTLIGRVGRDPEVRSTNSGSKVAGFSLATSEKWRDKRSGEMTEKTEWHNIVIWNEGTVKFVEQYVKKGDLLYIEGKLETRSYQDKDGNEKRTTEIVVKPFGGEVQKLNFDGGSSGGGRGDGDRGSRGSARDDGGSRGGGRQTTAAAVDDDIPF